MKGRFIVIEGLEGAGKSSAVATVTAWLRQRGHTFITVREPGGTPFAEALRNLVKQDWQEHITAEAELLLMYAARVQLVDNVIKPALEQGQWVVGDRHDLSSRAYQGGGRELGDSKLQQLKRLTLEDFQPDLTLYLDINPEIGLARALQRGDLDRIEKETLAFFHRTRERYLEIAANEKRIRVIDAGQDITQVQRDITTALEQQWPA